MMTPSTLGAAPEKVDRESASQLPAHAPAGISSAAATKGAKSNTHKAASK